MTKLNTAQAQKLAQLEAQHAQNIANRASRRQRLLESMAVEGRNDELAEALLMQEAKALGVPTIRIQAAAGAQNWKTYQLKLSLVAPVTLAPALTDNPELSVDTEMSEVTIHRFEDGAYPDKGHWVIPYSLNTHTDEFALLPEFSVNTHDPIQKRVSELMFGNSPATAWAIIGRWERMAQEILEGKK